MTTLQVVWFVLIGVLLVGYSVLDGFDLGAGFWSLLTRDDAHKRTIMNTLGPVWDGNEVWLLTGGGAIFAAFPHVYATVFSGMYLALMLVLYALITRAVCFEFRSKEKSRAWRNTWDWAFGLSSSVAALLFGVALGNIIRGLPLDKEMNFTGNFFTLLNGYSLLIGVLGFSMLATHGSAWLAMKTNGELGRKAGKWLHASWALYLGLFVTSSIVTFVFLPERTANYMEHAILWIFPVGALAAILGIRWFSGRGKPAAAFLSSAVSIAAMWGITGASIFPAMVPSRGDPSLALTLANSSSSELTLTAMLIMALIGMPLVIGYTAWVYRVFKGKVTADMEGY